MMEALGELPWYLPIVLALASLGLLMAGARRRSQPMRMTGVVMALLAALVIFLGEMIETPREAALRQTGELVSAIEKRNWDAAGKVLTDQTRITVLGSPLGVYRGRQQIITAATSAHDAFEFSSIKILSTSAVREGSRVVVSTRVASVQKATLDRPLNTDWRFVYESVGDQWQLGEVQLTKFGDRAASDAIPSFPTPR